jgi:hypothetical protein
VSQNGRQYRSHPVNEPALDIFSSKHPRTSGDKKVFLSFPILKRKSYFQARHYLLLFRPISVFVSVADPNLDPDLADPYVFEPPGSGSIRQSYGSGSGSGSGSFYHQAKIVRRTWIPTAL